MIQSQQNKTQSIIVGSVFALTSYILPNNEYFFLSQWQVIYNIQFHMHICILSTEEIHLAFLKTNVLFCRICELSRWEKRDNSQSLHWRHNDHDGVSNHQPHGCLLNRLFRRRSKKTSKLRVTGLCVGNSPGPVTQRASYAENVSIWWRHHVDTASADIHHQNSHSLAGHKLHLSRTYT